MLDHRSTSFRKTTPLIRIQVKHLFYADQSTKRLWDYVILPESQELMKKAGLQLQNTQERLNIWADPDKKEALIQQLELEKELSLVILLYPKEEFWLSFTAIPYPNPGISGILHFENHHLDKAYLSLAPTVSAKDYLFNTFRALPKNTLSNPDNSSSKPALSKKPYNSPIMPQTPTQKNIQNTIQKLTNQGYQQPAAWLQININHTTKQQWLESLKAGKPIATRSYELTFQARKAHWRYWIILRNKATKNRIHQIQIISEFDNIHFIGPEMYEIGKNSWAYVFVSKAPLAILERSPMKFQAKISYKIPQEVDYEGKRYHHQILKLPYPSLDLIHQNTKTSESVFYADIKLYL